MSQGNGRNPPFDVASVISESGVMVAAPALEAGPARGEGSSPFFRTCILAVTFY